jgi:hypothetical protein
LPTIDGILTGGLPILAYRLEWNSGGDADVFSLIYEGSTTTFTQPLTVGIKYKFRYAVKNDIDYSVDYSPVLITYGAKAPE